MRPPEFTGGNARPRLAAPRLALPGFNEAAGIHRRKRTAVHRDARAGALRASMRPPEFTGGNPRVGSAYLRRVVRASMRPPEFTGGNWRSCLPPYHAVTSASMRPPEFTGGNLPEQAGRHAGLPRQRFNEAAGIHRRKQITVTGRGTLFKRQPGFNEAAGIHRRKPAGKDSQRTLIPTAQGFNEAAGIHRRKPRQRSHASAALGSRFNEAAGIHRRKH